jgi:glycosyltransferase involved in cell wall biosynthesis
VLDSQNAEYHRLQSMASADSFNARSLGARFQLKPVERFEREATQSVARTTAVSRSEVEYFERFTPGRVDLVPNGVDTKALSFRERQSTDAQILFVGSLDYGANVDAAGFLIEDVLPRVEHPGVRLVVVGSNPRAEVQRLAKRSGSIVEVVGRVPTTDPYFANSSMLVVPLRFGGGTRLKILESFARGCPVASTSVGCEGLDVEHERELLIADGAPALAQAIDRLLADPELGRALAREGRQLAEKAYDWSAIADEFEHSLEQVIESTLRAQNASPVGAP